MTFYHYMNDIPDDLNLGPVIAIDTESMGLVLARDRLCLVQLTDGSGDVHFVQMTSPVRNRQCLNLAKMLVDPAVLKLFHFGRFDMAILYQHLGVLTQPVYCTKIASRMARTYTDRHGLKDLVRELLGVDLLKEQQSSDWGRNELTQEQMNYAASDVIHLHTLKELLDTMLLREGRMDLAAACFSFLPKRVLLDLGGWNGDIFAH